jgi:plasmid stabilization system protein ParE
MAQVSQVHILDLALEDIVERIDYVRQRWGEDIADDAYTELMDKLALLATQPHLGHVPSELGDLGITTFRLLVHESHTKILYEADDDGKTAHIHMVFSSNQDFQTLLYKRIMRS